MAVGGGGGSPALGNAVGVVASGAVGLFALQVGFVAWECGGIREQVCFVVASETERIVGGRVGRVTVLNILGNENVGIRRAMGAVRLSRITGFRAFIAVVAIGAVDTAHCGLKFSSKASSISGPVGGDRVKGGVLRIEAKGLVLLVDQSRRRRRLGRALVGGVGGSVALEADFILGGSYLKKAPSQFLDLDPFQCSADRWW